MTMQSAALSAHSTSVDRKISMHEVKTLTGLARSSLYQAIKASGFPRPYKFGRASRWSLAAVMAWIEQHAPAV